MAKKAVSLIPREKKKKPQGSIKKMLVSIIIGFVAVAFVGSFAYNYAARRGRVTSLAVINGEPVSTDSDSPFANYYRSFFEEERRRSENEGITEEKNIELLRRALDTVIQRTLIIQFSRKQGISVSRDTVLSEIVRKGYYASYGKKFDEETYNRVPESERQRVFKAEEEQLIIEEFLDDVVNSVKVSQLELQSFFQYTDYGRKIEYLFLRYDDLPEDKLKAFYNENPKLFERAHVAHILIKDEQKAREILQKVRETPQKFEEIAKAESEDPTKEKGGDLGWFYRGDMIPEFSQAAFELRKDEISDPVKTVFGYHIIKALDDPFVQPYDEALYRVKQEYVEEYRDEVERDTGKKSREIIEAAVVNPSSFREIASRYGLNVTRTDYITVDPRYITNEERTLPLFEILNVPSLIELVFSTDVNKVGGPVKTEDGEIIFRVVEEKELNNENFEKSKEYLSRLYKNIKGNYLFNDWYIHTLNNSKIVDNFNVFFKKTR